MTFKIIFVFTFTFNHFRFRFLLLLSPSVLYRVCKLMRFSALLSTFSAFVSVESVQLLAPLSSADKVALIEEWTAMVEERGQQLSAGELLEVLDWLEEPEEITPEEVADYWVSNAEDFLLKLDADLALIDLYSELGILKLTPAEEAQVQAELNALTTI